MCGKYLQFLLLAVRRVNMAVSGVAIFYHRSVYVDLYDIGTDELRKYIAKWCFVARSLCNNQQFKIPKFENISINSLYLRIINSKIKKNNYTMSRTTAMAKDPQMRTV